VGLILGITLLASRLHTGDFLTGKWNLRICITTVHCIVNGSGTRNLLCRTGGRVSGNPNG